MATNSIKIQFSTELYSIIVDFDELKNDAERDKYKKSLEEKIAVGLASKCFLKLKK